jgi:hypothetical protein
MLRIDVKRRDVGKISPPFTPDQFDRPAHYQLGDKFFDAHGYEIVPGEAFERPAEDEAGDDDEGGGIAPAALIAQANTMPWSQFKALAQEILGDGCPKNKGGIVARLQALVDGRVLKDAAPVQRETRPLASAAAGSAKPWPATPKEKPAVAPVPSRKPAAPQSASAPVAAAPAKPAGAKPAAANGTAGIDLAAWGRGEANYLNGQLTKAAKAQFSVAFTERRDILDHLIAEGVVSADEARTDL